MNRTAKIASSIVLLASLFQIAGAQDSTFVSTRKSSVIKSPHRATMLAAALPGMGQVYNQKYWKIPIVYAGFAGLGYGVYFNTSNHNKFTKAYQDFTDLIPETDSYIDLIRGADPSNYDPVLYPDSYIASEAQWIKEQLLTRVDYYKKYRDLSYIGIAAWYLISILDANVDASLSDYDVGERITLSLLPTSMPSFNGQLLALNLRIVKTF